MSQVDEIDEEESGDDRPGTPLDLRRVVRIVWGGKLILVGMAVLAAVAGVLIAKFGIHHTYVTSATLRYVGLPGQSAQDVQREMPALVAVANTEPILLRVRDEQEVGNVSIDQMRAIITVASDSGTGLVTFDAYADTPEKAADLANAVTEVFVEHHQERRRRELTNDVESLQQRITAASAELQTAQQTYDSFRNEHGITDLTVEQEGVISQAAQLRSQADLAATEVQALEARVAQLTRTLEQTPRTQTVTSGMSAQSTRLQELQQRLREARGQGLGEAHPQVQSLQRQVEALERQAASGTSESETTGTRANSQYEQIRNSLSSAETELEATRRRHASLEELALAAQERSNRFGEIEGQAASLLAQLTVMGTLVEQLTEQRALAEDQMQDVPTGFRMVSAALPPEDAVPSKKKMVVAAGLPIGVLLLTLFILLLRGLWGLKLQTPAEVAWWGKGPVVGTSTWPRDPRGLDDLLSDMDDMTIHAEGTLLVVGATDAERETANGLAAELGPLWDEAATLMDLPSIFPAGDELPISPPRKPRNSLPAGTAPTSPAVAPTESPRSEPSRSEPPRSEPPRSEPPFESLGDDPDFDEFPERHTMPQWDLDTISERPKPASVRPRPSRATLLGFSVADALNVERGHIEEDHSQHEHIDFTDHTRPPRQSVIPEAIDGTVVDERVIERVEAVVEPRLEPVSRLQTFTCTDVSGPSAIRRAARRADRVLVVVHANEVSAPYLSKIRERLGREDGIAFVLVGVSDAVAELPDRVGAVNEFWATTAS